MLTPLHRMTIVTALALALLASTMSGPAVARPADIRTEAQTSTLAGTTDRQDLRNPDNRAPSAVPHDTTPSALRDLPSPDVFDAAHRNEIALALERYYSTYGSPKPVPVAEAPAPVDDPEPFLPIAIAIAAALTIAAASVTILRRRNVAA
jgi:hypothetical protein